MRAALCESAWGASKTKDSIFKSKYHRLKGRRGSRRALVAVGHSILKTCYFVLKKKIAYQEFTFGDFDNRKKEKVAESYIKRLNKMGFEVKLNVPASGIMDSVSE